MDTYQEVLKISTHNEEVGRTDITKHVQGIITRSGFVQGIVLVHTLHTTTGLTKKRLASAPVGYLVQENEPLLMEDLSTVLGEGAEKFLIALPNIASGRNRFLDFVPEGLLDILLKFIIAILRPTGYLKHDDFLIRPNINPDERKNASAHLKAAMIRESLLWSFSSGKLNLGTWQSILFWDFDSKGRADREIQVVVVGEKEQKITEALKSAVRDFFSTNIYKGYLKPFELQRIIWSELNPDIVCAVPVSVLEEIEINDQDRDWEKRLADLGERFNVDLCLPHWCYQK